MAPAAPYPRRLCDHASLRCAAGPARAPCGRTPAAVGGGVTPANALEVAHEEFDRIVNLMMLTVDLLQDVHDDGERGNIPAIRKATSLVLGNALERHSQALEQLSAFEQAD
jgi:hypothetical protein